MPSKFPIGTVAACARSTGCTTANPAQARAFAKALYQAFFVEDRDISAAGGRRRGGETVGIDAAALSAALGETRREGPRQAEVDAALAKGVFGSPYFIVDGEPFWGNDRIPMLEEWVKRGGW